MNVRAEVTFNSAIERPAGERTAYLAEACGENDALHAEVMALLKAHDAADSFMAEDAPLSPEVEEQMARLKPEEAGETIGPYKLREQIGEGGFGTVWVADQEKPVRRRVALKIIKMGMDTKEVIDFGVAKATQGRLTDATVHSPADSRPSALCWRGRPSCGR